VAGVGARVLIFSAGDGELLHALKGHKVGGLHGLDGEEQRQV
jgi:hypothetical protein